MSRRLDKPGPLKRQRLATSRPVRRGGARSRRGLWLILAPACLAAALVGGAALVMQPAARRAEVKPAPASAAAPGSAAQRTAKVAEAAPPPKPESAPVPPPPAAPAALASAAPAATASAPTIAAAPRITPPSDPATGSTPQATPRTKPEPAGKPEPAPSPAPQVTASIEQPVAAANPAPAVQPSPPQAQNSKAVSASRDAPMDCVPEGLKAVLNEVAAKFGPVSVISTNKLNTDNHSAGSVRYNLHLACKAVDFKVQAETKAVTDFLRTRPEVAGINSYRHNGVIHIDLNESAAFARGKTRPRQATE